MFWFLRKPSGKQTVTIDTSLASCGELDMRNYAGGCVSVTSGVTLLTFYAAHETGGDFLEATDKDDNPITLTVSSTKITQLPQELYDFPFIKAFGNAAGTGYFSLKS